MRIVVDLNRCLGYAQCVPLAPEVLKLSGEEALTICETLARSNALDVIVGLLSGLDDGRRSSGTDFYDPLCEALCRLTSMRRAVLMLYDESLGRVVAGVAFSIPCRIRYGVWSRNCSQSTLRLRGVRCGERA